MTTGFAEEMEHKARKFVDRLIEDGVLANELYGDNRNFKPWYSPRDLIDQAAKNGRAERVLIGVNPGGCPGEHDPTTKKRCWERPMNAARPFNAYIDEKWKGAAKRGEASLQVAVQAVFDALYPGGSESKLRNTVCFNVCPFRTHDASCIPPKLWTQSVQWCLEVLECLKPNRIICISNIGPKTPWTAVGGPRKEKACFSRDVRATKMGFPNFVLADKAGRRQLNGCEIISTPHLSWARGAVLENTLSALREYASQPQTP